MKICICLILYVDVYRSIIYNVLNGNNVNLLFDEWKNVICLCKWGIVICYSIGENRKYYVEWENFFKIIYWGNFIYMKCLE